MDNNNQDAGLSHPSKDLEEISQFSLKDLYYVLKNYKIMVSIIFLSIFFSSLYLTLTSKPIYQTSSTIMIRQDQKTMSIFSMLDMGLTKDRNYIENEIEVLKSKIHRVVVTGADLDYIGSITLDQTLIQAAGLCEYEKVHILNISNGSRLETYVIKGPPDSGEVCINGAAAHLVSRGDSVIIVAYGLISESKFLNYKPSIIVVDGNNKPVD